MIFFSLILLNFHKCSLRMIRRQTRMAASAPMLNFNVCPSWISSQFSPQNPSGHMQRYRNRGSRFTHWAPFKQGKSRHSFRSIQPLPSGDITRPSPQLFLYLSFFFIVYEEKKQHKWMNERKRFILLISNNFSIYMTWMINNEMLFLFFLFMMLMLIGNYVQLDNDPVLSERKKKWKLFMERVMNVSWCVKMEFVVFCFFTDG